MYKITKSNYYVLRRILKNNPVFAKDPYHPLQCGQVYLHLYPNTVGHRSLRSRDLNGGSPSPNLGCMPLTYKGKGVILDNENLVRKENKKYYEQKAKSLSNPITKITVQPYANPPKF